MPANKTRQKKTDNSRLWHLIDALVVCGILALASRPDGLAIAIVAALVSAIVLVFRFFARLKPRTELPKKTAHRTQPPRVTITEARPEKRRSWLTEDQ